jgi:hypothetical protein
VLDGETLVAEARSVAAVDAEVPGPVSLDQARLAAGRYRGLTEGEFSRCFVCGRTRADSFGVFAGAVEGRRLVASPWTPPSWTAEPDGRVAARFVWAVLDCPTFFASYLDRELGRSVLARLTARIDAPLTAGEEQIVVAWPIGAEGRKLDAGSAVLSAAGEPLAVARALLVEPRAD